MKDNNTTCDGRRAQYHDIWYRAINRWARGLARHSVRISAHPAKEQTDRFERIASIPHDGVLILGGAIGVCAPGAEARRIGEQLVDLAPANPAEALGPLVRFWDRVAPSVRARAAALDAETWRAALSELPSDDAAVFDVVRELGKVELLPDAAAGLVSDDRAAAQAAGDAVLSLARRLGESDLHGAAASPVLEALLASAASYDEHRQREALIAVVHAMGSPARCQAVRAWLTGSDESIAMSLRSAAKRSRDGSMVGGAFVWMSVPALSSAAHAIVTDPSSDASSALRWSHLAQHPARRRILRRDEFDATLSSWIHAGLPCDGAMARLGSLASSPAVRSDLAEAAFVSPDAAGRFALASGRLADEDDLAGDLAFDRTPAVARVAARRVERSHTASRAERLARLERSEHAFVRGLARRSRCGLAARVEDRRTLASDRMGMIGTLRGLIASGPVRARVEAMAQASTLGLTDDVELELLVALSDRSEADGHDEAGMIAAAALRALASGTTEPGRSAIRACLHSSVARVRANGIEALAQRARRQTGAPFDADLGLIRGALADEHHRVRSTAALMLARLTPDDRATGLAISGVIQELLVDERTLHRVAGLWLAERLSLGHPWVSASAAARVAELARAEPIEAVRARASRCATLMVRVVRSGWASRAPSMEHAGPGPNQTETV